jgi:hypothetical protein
MRVSPLALEVSDVGTWAEGNGPGSQPLHGSNVPLEFENVNEVSFVQAYFLVEFSCRVQMRRFAITAF